MRQFKLVIACLAVVALLTGCKHSTPESSSVVEQSDNEFSITIPQEVATKAESTKKIFTSAWSTGDFEPLLKELYGTLNFGDMYQLAENQTLADYISQYDLCVEGEIIPGTSNNLQLVKELMVITETCTWPNTDKTLPFALCEEDLTRPLEVANVKSEVLGSIQQEDYLQVINFTVQDIPCKFTVRYDTTAQAQSMCFYTDYVQGESDTIPYLEWRDANETNN